MMFDERRDSELEGRYIEKINEHLKKRTPISTKGSLEPRHRRYTYQVHQVLHTMYLTGVSRYTTKYTFSTYQPLHMMHLTGVKK